jgi:hypothetical protein
MAETMKIKRYPLDEILEITKISRGKIAIPLINFSRKIQGKNLTFVKKTCRLIELKFE